MAALACSVAGCESDPTAPIPLTLRISAAQRRWEQAKIEDYIFTSSVSCFCPTEYARPLSALVRGGRIVNVVDLGTLAMRPLTYRQPIDSLFALLRREALSPWRVDVEFDQRLGYPRRISYGQQELDGGAIITIDTLIVPDGFLESAARSVRP